MSAFGLDPPYLIFGGFWLLNIDLATKGGVLMDPVSLATFSNWAGIVGAGISFAQFASNLLGRANASSKYSSLINFYKKASRHRPDGTAELFDDLEKNIDALSNLEDVSQFIYSYTIRYILYTFVVSLLVIFLTTRIIPLDINSQSLFGFENLEREDFIFVFIGIIAIFLNSNACIKMFIRYGSESFLSVNTQTILDFLKRDAGLRRKIFEGLVLPLVPTFIAQAERLHVRGVEFVADPKDLQRIREQIGLLQTKLSKIEQSTLSNDDPTSNFGRAE